MTLRIPADHLDHLDRIARDTSTSRSQLIRDAISEYLQAK